MSVAQVLINVWCLWAPTGLVDKLLPMDVLKVWGYDIAWLLFLDLVKMFASGVWEKFKPVTWHKNWNSSKNSSSKQPSG